MRVMKNSGIDWINIVPNSWHTTRLKSVLVERNEKNNPIKTTNLLSLSIERGVFPYSEKTGGGNKAKENFEDYKLAYVNDIVLNSMNVVVGAVGLSKYYGCVSPVYYTLYSRNNELYNINYYNYIFQSEVFQKNLWGLGNGIVVKESDNGKLNTIRMRIPMEKLNGIILPVPSIEEQEKIASFLDEKIQEIDNAINKTKETIEDYKKLKQSIITKIVTEGLDDSFKCQKTRLKNVAIIVRVGSPRPIDRFLTDSNDGVNWIKIGDTVKGNKYIDKTSQKIIKEGVKNSRYLTAGDLILTNSMSFGEPYILNIDGCIHDGWVAFSQLKGIKKEYLYYFLISDFCKKQFDEQVAGGVVQNLNVEKISKTIIYLPIMQEQIRIVEYLDKKSNEIDKLIAAKEKIVEELESYKKSVIYEYVTGKKEVK